MVGALADKLEHGRLRLFCVSSVDSESWYCKKIHPRHRVERHLHYEDYILNEVVPLVRHLTRHDDIGVTGCSFGAYHAMVLALRHPYTFTSCITMGGAFDITQFLDGYHDEDCYFLNPPSFLPGLSDAYYLDQFRRNKWVIVTGDHDICRAPNEQFSALMSAKGIPARAACVERLQARLAVLAADGAGVLALRFGRPMKKIGVLFGMENTFPGALVERINGDERARRHGRVRPDRRRADGRAVRLRRHRRPHLARHSVLPRVPEERRALRHQDHQQPVLVERRRQVLQLRAGHQARRRHSADHPAAAQGASDRHHRAVDAQPEVPARLGCDLRVRRLPRVPEAVRRRRLARRLQGQQPRGVLRRLRPDQDLVHDAAARRRTSRSTSAATSSGRSRCTSCPTTRGRRSTSATC